MRSFTLLILLSLAFTKSYGQKTDKDSTMIDDQLLKLVEEIKQSRIYEDVASWEERGLNPSEESIVHLLRASTNKFLDELTKIHLSQDNTDTKLKKITTLVDELPWSELDTEEKEFMADTLAPAIQACGFNPWLIF